MKGARRFRPLYAPLWAALLAGACAPGSCGKPAETSQPPPGLDKTGSPPASNLEGTPIAPFHGAKKRSTEPSPTSASTSTAKAPVLAVHDLSPRELRDRLSSPGKPLLIMVVKNPCLDCHTVLSVLEPLAAEFSGRVEIARINGRTPGASGVLPASLHAEPLPAFVLYQKGQVTSLLQGLPFPRAASAKDRPQESAEEHRKRLSDWFRGALTRLDLAPSPWRTRRRSP